MIKTFDNCVILRQIYGLLEYHSMVYITQGTPRNPEEPTPSNIKVTKENGPIWFVQYRFLEAPFVRMLRMQSVSLKRQSGVLLKQHCSITLATSHVQLVMSGHKII